VVVSTGIAPYAAAPLKGNCTVMLELPPNIVVPSLGGIAPRVTMRPGILAEKALLSILDATGMYTLVRLWQFVKVPLPMLFTIGKDTVVRLVQPQKALSSMLVTVGKVTLTKLVQPKKASLLILVIVFMCILLDAEGYATRFILSRTNAFPSSITLKAPVPVKIKEVRLEQRLKALSLIIVAAGKDTLFRLMQ